jgi:flagellar hook-length control protein FliK
MDVSALDSLLRTDASPANQTRRFGDGSGERFAKLLDRADGRAEERTARPAARKPESDDDLRARPERPERPERAEKDDRPERAEKPERAERPERPQRAAKAEKTEEAKPTDDAPAQEDKPLAEAKPVDEAPTEEVVAEKPVAETEEPATSNELVKMSALALAHQVGILLAQAHAVATPTDTDAQAGEIGEAVKSARATPVLPLPAQAAQAQAAAAESKTEDFADFVLRGAANPAALVAAAAASDDPDAKADAKADAKSETKGQLLVTISQPMAVAAPVAPVAAVAVQASAQAAAAKPDLAVAADGASAAAAASLDDKAKQTAKPGENAPLFAQSFERAQNAQAAAPADTKPRPIVVPPHEQVALHVKKAVAEGKDMIVIRLNPVELGRIEVKLEIGADGTMRAAFAAERSQTLDALKNDSRQLERALQEAGLKPDAGGLNFSLRGDNRENAQAFADMGREFRGKQGRDDAEPGAVSRDAQAPQAAYRGTRRASGGLDLAV